MKVIFTTKKRRIKKSAKRKIHRSYLTTIHPVQHCLSHGHSDTRKENWGISSLRVWSLWSEPGETRNGSGIKRSYPEPGQYRSVYVKPGGTRSDLLLQGPEWIRISIPYQIFPDKRRRNRNRRNLLPEEDNPERFKHVYTENKKREATEEERKNLDAAKRAVHRFLYE